MATQAVRIWSNGSYVIDIDHDEDTSNAFFKITKDDAGATLFSINESGAVVFSNGVSIDSDGVITGASIDHGATTGRDDDDHTQYQKETDFTAGSILFRGTSVIDHDNANLFWDNTNKRLGIGIVAPDGRLHVHEGTAGVVTANSDADTFVMENSDHGGMSILTPANKVGGIYFGDPDGNVEGIVQYRHSSNQLEFWTNTSTEPWFLPRMTITSAGRVGIGTNNPDTLLHVEGKITAEGLWDDDQDTGIQVEESAGEDKIRFDTAGTERMIIDNAGKVGIGTASPARALDLGSGGNDITFGDLITVANERGIYWHSTNAYAIYRTAEGWTAPFAQLKLNWATGIIIDGGTAYGESGITMQAGGGNVSIGSPVENATDTFHIFGGGIRATVTDTDGDVALYISADTAKVLFAAYGSTVSGTFAGLAKANLTVFEGQGTSAFLLSTVNSGAAPIIFSPGRVEKIRITSTGNLGIGTPSPNQKLTIEGTMSLKERAAASADTTAYGQLWVKTASPTELWFTDDEGGDHQIAYV